MEAENRFKQIFSELKTEGVTQVKFGEAIGKTQQTISRYLSGEILPNEAVALLIESKYGYRKEWILNGELPKKIDRAAVLGEVARISKQGRDLDKVPEIRDALPNIIKLKNDEYQMLVALIYKFIKK